MPIWFVGGSRMLLSLFGQSPSLRADVMHKLQYTVNLRICEDTEQTAREASLASSTLNWNRQIDYPTARAQHEGYTLRASV
jgi:hypothetical protein